MLFLCFSVVPLFLSHEFAFFSQYVISCLYSAAKTQKNDGNYDSLNKTLVLYNLNWCRKHKWLYNAFLILC